MPLSTVVDDVTRAPSSPARTRETFEEMVRLDDLIRRRTFLEVAESDADVDRDNQARMALDTFRRNGSVTSIDDRQVTVLDESGRPHARSRVTSPKFAPLLGA